MRVNSLTGNRSDIHLSYCTNIHPGESWEHLDHNLRHYLPEVKARVCPNEPMGVGLRLPAVAAKELINQPALLQEFKQWLDDNGFYIFTINGFPYGQFHNKVVKEDVYEPDWSSEHRLIYTQQLAEILAFLLPDDVAGSISTVPIGYRSRSTSERQKLNAANNLIRFAIFANQLKNTTGKTIQLALEPEPACVFERHQDVVEFFTRYLFCGRVSREPEPVNVQILRTHLGMCLDTCHSAVMFEDPCDFLDAMHKHNIPVYKVQLTAALKIPEWNSSLSAVLEPYAEPTYLHQTCIKNNQTQNIRFFVDLPEALASVKPGEELRSHFHVPVFASELETLSTTQNELIHFLRKIRHESSIAHLEVETYTFNVLPESLALGSVADNISRELQWTLRQLR